MEGKEKEGWMSKEGFEGFKGRDEGAKGERKPKAVTSNGSEII